MLFEEQTVELLLDAIDRFEATGHRISPADCRRNAERFGHARFCAEFANAIAEQLQERPPRHGSVGAQRRAGLAAGYAGVTDSRRLGACAPC